MNRYLVGQLLGPSGKFFKMADTLWSGEVHLDRIQRCVPILREHDPSLRPVGRLIHIEDGPNGTYIVGEITDPTFTAADERRWLSCRFDGAESATSAVGMHLRFDAVHLKEISVTAKPAATNTCTIQITTTDPRDHRGGASWGTSDVHRAVLNRCHDAFAKRPSRRSLGAIEVLDPFSLGTPPKPTGPRPNLTKVRAQLLGEPTDIIPAAAATLPTTATKRRTDEMPAELAAASSGGHHIRKNVGVITAVR